MLAKGDWTLIRNFRKSSGKAFCKMKSGSGGILAANERAEALAEHLEKVQWALRLDMILSSKS